MNPQHSVTARKTLKLSGCTNCSMTLDKWSNTSSQRCYCLSSV